MEEWYQQVSSSVDGSRVIVMLLANKCDLPAREVTYNEGMDFARSHNFGYMEVSAKTGANVRASFQCLVKGYPTSNFFIITFIEIYKAQMQEEGIPISPLPR